MGGVKIRVGDGPTPHPENHNQATLTPSFNIHTTLTYLTFTVTLTAGDIIALKDMPLTSLVLGGCGKLTGEWCASWVGLVGGWGHDQ